MQREDPHTIEEDPAMREHEEEEEEEEVAGEEEPAEQEEDGGAGASSIPPPPGGPPPVPDWLLQKIAVQTGAASSSAGEESEASSSTSSSSTSSSSSADASMDLAAMLTNRRQLRSTVVVEKQVIETPQDELRRALTRRMSNKAMAKKDEIADVVAKFKEGCFRTFDELARLVHQALRMQNEVGNLELIKVAKWPIDLINALKEIVTIVENVRRNIKRTEDILRDQTKKGVTMSDQAVNNIKDCVRVLQYAPQELKRAEEMVGMQIITVPLQKEETVKKANKLTEACISLIFEVAMNKYKQPIPRNSFNLRYRINNTISILETVVDLCRQIGGEPLKEKRQQADQAVRDLQHKYADILNISVATTTTIADASEIPSAPQEPALAQPELSAPSPFARQSSGSLRHSGSASRMFVLHNHISERLLEKVKAFVNNMKEGEEGQDQKVLSELSKEDNRARTPLEVAILQGDLGIVQELLSLCSHAPAFKAFVRSYQNGEGNSYVHLASSIAQSSSSVPIMDALLWAVGLAVRTEPAIAWLSCTNQRGETPLHCAAKVGNVEAVRYLIESGVSVLEQDKFGRQALYLLAVKTISQVVVPPPQSRQEGSLPGLKRYFLNTALSDVSFNVCGNVFPAHRIVLCAQSPNFKSMLEGGEWQESQQKEVHLQGVSPVVFKHLLEYMYCGESSFSTSDVDFALQILEAADRFLVDGLKEKAEHVLYKLLMLENAFLLYTRARTFSAHRLRDASAYLILTNYEKMEWADSDRSLLLDIVSTLPGSADPSS